jgi:hypothetical protein
MNAGKVYYVTYLRQNLAEKAKLVQEMEKINDLLNNPFYIPT